jgi:hypothetical protein
MAFETRAEPLIVAAQLRRAERAVASGQASSSFRFIYKAI